MNCSKCGLRGSTTDSFCGFCGARMVKVNPVPASSQDAAQETLEASGRELALPTPPIDLAQQAEPPVEEAVVDLLVHSENSGRTSQTQVIQRRHTSLRIVIASGIATVLLLGAGIYLMLRPGNSKTFAGSPSSPTTQQAESTDNASMTPDLSSSPTLASSTSAKTRSFPKVNLSGHECARKGSGPYAAVAAGNEVTSCPFAINVRTSYLEAQKNGQSITIIAFSPVTKKEYSMLCTGDQPVTCVGGKGAVVYLYGGRASFS